MPILAAIWLATTIIIIPGFSLSSQQDRLSYEERVERYVSSFPEHQEFQGVILVAHNGRILFHKGYGLASREFNIPAGPNTKFQVGSVTKAFTAILALKMAESGLLELDKTICDYLPLYPAETGRKITLRQLLSHTSGIPHHIDALPDFWNSHDKIFHAPQELWELFANVPLVHEPGQQFTYSSPGYYILGAILQQVAKKSYAELLREHVFGPLGMKDSRVENNRTVQSGMAMGYMRGLTGLIHAGFEDKSTSLAAGDIVTTAYDLYLWDRGMRAEPGQIISTESKGVLYSPVLPGHMMSIGGPILRIPYDSGGKTFSLNRISGSSTGYAAAMDRFLEIDGCVIVLSNVQDAPVEIMTDHIGDFLLRYELDTPVGVAAPDTITPPQSTGVSDESACKFLGFFRNADGTISAVVKDGGRLFYLLYSEGRLLPPVQELVLKSGDVLQFGNRAGLECRLVKDQIDGRPILATLRNGRSVAEARSIESPRTELSEYAGSYTSVELQKTFRLSWGSKGLVAEKFLGDVDLRLIPLESDLFGFDRGLIKFKRAAPNAITGFTLLTKDVDSFLGSKFVKISSD
jgi:CubicO group peptidase (beta-lactamase class C family)